jgi:allophanate hydrolase
MVALTGASMPASLNQKPLDWNASHYLFKGGILNLGAPQNGRYSYLHLRGGFTAPKIFNSSSAQPSAGIGKYSIQADILAQSEKNLEPLKCQAIKPFDRFNSTTLRLIESFQTHFFTSETVERFTETEFLIDNQSNRSGIKLTHTGSGFSISNQLKIVSDMIVPGDIQMTGYGQPFVLLGDCQTMGGYPRIGCIIPPDIPAIAQLKTGKKVKFKFISRDEANTIVSEDGKKLEIVKQRCSEPIRDPQKITDLMDLNLIGGAVWAKD